MLSTLRIRHIGVIDDAMLEFGPGFTALTGETGAGKTMIVTGLTMLLGGRLDRGRTSGSSTVDGTLAMSGHDELAAALDELGAEEDDGEVLVVRRMTRDGRSRAQIGGVPVPIGTLSRLVGTAVTVHGQSDQQRLRDPDAQRIALDRFATAEVGPLVERHREIWSERTELTEQLTELDGLLAERERRGTALREALERIEQADPQPGRTTPCAPSSSGWATPRSCAAPRPRPSSPWWATTTVPPPVRCWTSPGRPWAGPRAPTPPWTRSWSGSTPLASSCPTWLRR